MAELFLNTPLGGFLSSVGLILVCAGWLGFMIYLTKGD